MRKLFSILVFAFLLFSPNISKSNIVEELTKLNNLYKEGAINKEEFSKAKSILLKSKQSNETNEVNTKKKVKKKIKKEETKSNKKISKKKLKQEDIKPFEDLTNTYASLQDVEEFGSFERINYSPEGMFHPKKHKNFSSKANKSMKAMYLTFVQQKNLMEKYPENVMRAMGYFEFFYQDQLKKKKKSIEAFKSNYPEVPLYAKKDIKTLYSLNQARKKMREAMGLTLDDSIEVALDRYMTMYNVLSKAEKKKNKLTSKEKRLKKRNNKLKQNIAALKKNLSLKKEKRIKSKEFAKNIDKNIKQIESSFRLLSKQENPNNEFYKTLNKLFNKTNKLVNKCLADCTNEQFVLIDDGLSLVDSMMSDVSSIIIKKEHTQDMSKVDMESIPDEQKNILAEVSFAMKNKKIKKRNLLQQSVLNLDNNDYEIDDYVEEIKKNGFEVSSIDMTFDNVDTMKRWAMKDWANSWKGALPQELKDSDGNLVEFSEENIEDIKAQLAMNTFNQMIDVKALSNELKGSINESVKEIAKEIQSSGGFNLDSWLNQDFTITLNNYSQLVGNAVGIEMNDFNDLTKWANEYYKSDMSADDYAQHWESAQYLDSTSNWGDVTKGVELIDTVGSFEAASIAKELGTDLQTVADSISQAATVGISTDLEAAAQGLGYGSFADAVAAYNAQYGTNYTEEEAAAALGQ